MAVDTGNVRRSSPSSGCGTSKAAIDARILFVTAYFKTHRDSDDRARVYDTYLVRIPAACLTTGQAAAIQGLAGLIQAQARAEEESFYEGIPGLIGAVADVVMSVPEFLGTILKLLTSAETWVRVGEFIAGIILILLGLKQVAAVMGVNIPIPGVAK